MLNIALLGPAGAGKSCLVNHAASALSGWYQHVSCTGAETQRLRKTVLPGDVLRLWDTCPWEHLHVRASRCTLGRALIYFLQLMGLEAMLRGDMLTGADLLALPPDTTKRIPSAADKVHAALILLPFPPTRQMIVQASDVVKHLRNHGAHYDLL